MEEVRDRLKVLITAHECSPYQGSECAEGWNLVTRLCAFHDITVLYARGSQFAPDAYEKAIEDYYRHHPKPAGLTFIAIPQPKTTLWLARINKKLFGSLSSIGLPVLYYAGYKRWQKEAYRVARSLMNIPTPNIPTPTPPSTREGLSSEVTSLRQPATGNRQPATVLHHLTSISFRDPGYLWRLPVPFVWGPTGGLTAVPLRFAAGMGAGTLVREGMRTLINITTFALNPRIQKAIRKSSLIYAFSEEDKRRFIGRGAERVELMTDAGCNIHLTPDVPTPNIPTPTSRNIGTGSPSTREGLSSEVSSGHQPATGNRQPATGFEGLSSEASSGLIPPPWSREGDRGWVRNQQPATILRVLWVGQLIRRKALDILLEAIEGDETLRNNVELTIIGDGPLRKRTHPNPSLDQGGARASRDTHNSQPRTSELIVVYKGWLSRAEVFDHMHQADVLVHTSYREATSNVIPEALSCGLPVICHDISGMALAIGETCGIKVPLKSYRHSVEGFRNALLTFLATPRRDGYAVGAERRAAELSWDKMAERMANDYVRIAKHK